VARLLECVILDLDGTLVEFPHEWIKRAKQTSLERLAASGFRVPQVSTSRPLSEIIAEVIALNGDGHEEAVRRIVDSTFKVFEIAAAAEAKVRDGAKALLESISSTVSVAVATNNSRDAALRSLEVAGLTKYVDVVVSRDEVERMKPDPQMILRAVRECRSTLNGTVHIGDSYVDVLAARNAGVLSMAVLGGVSNLEDFLRHRPHLLARDLEEARRFLEAIVLGKRNALPTGSERNSFFPLRDV
jgi:HAD superfamily hydrolase (TIGR01509 family)